MSLAEFLLALGISLALMVSTLWLHYQVLRFSSDHLADLPLRNRAKIMAVVFSSFIGHMLEIGLFALAYYFLVGYTDLGQFSKPYALDAGNLFYFSTVSFSTLGMSPVQMEGPLKIVVGLEALNGFLLITWSASHTYTIMQELWGHA